MAKKIPLEARVRVQGEVDADDERRDQQPDVQDVLPAVGDRPLRQDFLQLAERHQRPREGQEAEQHLERDDAHAELVDGPGVDAALAHREQVLARADEADGEAAEAVRQRRPLRHRGHRHEQRQRQPRDRADHQADDDPLVVLHLRLDDRADDGQGHADLAGDDALPRGRRRAQPLERHDEEPRRDQVARLRERRHRQALVAHGRRHQAERQQQRGHARLGLTPLEHLEHAVGDQESRHDVGHGRGHGDGRQRDDQRMPLALLLAQHQHRADQADGRDRVGQRHQRRVQQRRHPADHIEPEERRENEHEQVRKDVHSGRRL